MLTVGQGFLWNGYGIGNIAFHGYQSLDCLVLSFIFFFSRVVREDNLLPVKSELKWAFDFWLGYKENLRWNS